MNLFKPAVRQAVKLKVGFEGPSGSVKTYSALLLARGIVGPEGRIALIDTENGSASLYSDLTDFDVMTLAAPFGHMKFIEAIQAAIDAGYNILVIDSYSHAWAGPGGTLDIKNELDIAKPTMQWPNWGQAKAGNQEILALILAAPIDIIVTLRSKQKYESVKEGGKTVIKKLGLEPIQQPDIDYEFTIIFDGDADTHMSRVVKNRTPLWQDGMPILVTEEHGKILADWRDSGAEFIPPLTEATKLRLRKVIKALGLTGETWIAHCAPIFVEHGISGIERIRDLTEEQGSAMYKALKIQYDEKKTKEAENATV